jgi:tRNA (guanine-N7-)-methyltransferase
VSQLNPDDFIITRKRKKYKFALFSNSPLCFEHDEWDKTWRPDVVELGAGTGFFGLELARRHPELRILAIDVKADRLQSGAMKASQLSIPNVRFLRTRADLLPEIFEPQSLAAIWLTFPDPFLKDRAEKHRLTNARFLDIYRRLLGADGSLYLKHDNAKFFNYSLEQLVENSWQLNELSFDLHDSNLSDDYKILTTYELRWLGEGLKTRFVKASIVDNTAV